MAVLEREEARLNGALASIDESTDPLEALRDIAEFTLKPGPLDRQRGLSSAEATVDGLHELRDALRGRMARGYPAGIFD